MNVRNYRIAANVELRFLRSEELFLIKAERLQEQIWIRPCFLSEIVHRFQIWYSKTENQPLTCSRVWKFWIGARVRESLFIFFPICCGYLWFFAFLRIISTLFATNDYGFGFSNEFLTEICILESQSWWFLEISTRSKSHKKFVHIALYVMKRSSYKTIELYYPWNDWVYKKKSGWMISNQVFFMSLGNKKICSHRNLPTF